MGPEHHTCAFSRRPGKDDQTNNLEGGKQPGGLAKAQASYVMWWPGCRFVLPLLLNCPMRQQRRETIAPCREIFHLLGVGGKQDARLETAAALPAVPNMTGALIAPVLRPFGGDQLITALNAFRSEA
jgi:hypothetical protein